MSLGICKYCGQQKELIGSHIIPKCLLKLPDVGSYVAVKPKAQKLDKNPIFQNGWKEPLLCHDCDNKLGKLDKYGAQMLFQTKPDKIIDFPNVKLNLFSLDHVNYLSLKKLFASILWRASISSEIVSLGPYEDKVLKFIKGEEADDPNLFVPLIYKKSSSNPANKISGIFPYKELGKHSYKIRFIDYEIVVIINAKHSNNPKQMKMYQEGVFYNALCIIETTIDSPLDQKILGCLQQTRGKI